MNYTKRLNILFSYESTSFVSFPCLHLYALVPLPFLFLEDNQCCYFVFIHVLKSACKQSQVYYLSAFLNYILPKPVLYFSMYVGVVWYWVLFFPKFCQTWERTKFICSSVKLQINWKIGSQLINRKAHIFAVFC